LKDLDIAFFLELRTESKMTAPITQVIKADKTVSNKITASGFTLKLLISRLPITKVNTWKRINAAMAKVTTKSKRLFILLPLSGFDTFELLIIIFYRI